MLAIIEYFFILNLFFTGQNRIDWHGSNPKIKIAAEETIRNPKLVNNIFLNIFLFIRINFPRIFL